LLETARRIVAPGAIQLKKRGASRLPHSAEAMALLVSALGAVDRWTGVNTLTLDVDGQPVALAVIENARFGQDQQGHTTLSIPIPEQPEKEIS
jgi:hypothetical protein